MARRMRGEGAVYQRHDHVTCPPLDDDGERPKHTCKGRWVGSINVAPQGARAKRKVVYGTTQREVVNKIGAIRRDLAEQRTVATSSVRLDAYLDAWLGRSNLKPTTRRGYRSIIDQHIAPNIGRVRLDQLTVDHVYRLHEAMRDRSTTTQRNVHAVLRAALNQAMKEKRIGTNVAAVADAPVKAEPTRRALSKPERLAVKSALTDDPMESRWLVALVLGVRQGECLGLTWDEVDLDARTINLAWSLRRVPYRHGCDLECGTKRPASCPERELDLTPGQPARVLDGNLCLIRPKTKGSRRVVPIVDELIGPMRRRWVAYLTERQAPGYCDHGLVWARPDGRPIDPRSDYYAWRDLLAAVGIEPLPLHSARHTAATDFDERGVPTAVIAEIMGHSDWLTTEGYTHRSIETLRNAIESD